jgi:hypothetical protein
MNQTGRRTVQRDLNIQASLKIRQGAVRGMVNRYLVPEPYMIRGAIKFGAITVGKPSSSSLRFQPTSIAICLITPRRAGNRAIHL